MSINSIEFLGKKFNKQIKTNVENPDLKEISDTLFDLSDAKDVLSFIDIDKLKFLAKRFYYKYVEEEYDEKDEDIEVTEINKINENIDNMTKDEYIDFVHLLVKRQKYYIDFDFNLPIHAHEMIHPDFDFDKCFFEFTIFRTKDIGNIQNKQLNNSIELDNKKVLKIRADFEIDIRVESNNDTDVWMQTFKMTVERNCSNEEYVKLVQYLNFNEDVFVNYLNDTFVFKFNYHEKILEFIEEIVFKIQENAEQGKKYNKKVITKYFEEHSETF